MEQTTSRLRKTFHYNADDNDSDDSLPEALDEEEQESLIRTLRTHNAQRDRQYTTAFAALPLLCTLAYLPRLLSPLLLQLPPSQPASDSDSDSSGHSAAVLSILSITSLLASAHIMYFSTPPPHTSSHMGPPKTDKGPLELYLPRLNAVLAALVAMAGWVAEEEAGREGPGWWFGLVPGVVFAVVLVARRIMGSVDVGELEGLRYGYKGA